MGKNVTEMQETVAELLDAVQTVGSDLQEELEGLRNDITDMDKMTADRVDILQTGVTDLQEQIVRLREEITGFDSRHSPSCSLDEIGGMLKGWQVVFEPQYKMKAFELFDAYPDYSGKEPSAAAFDMLVHAAQAATVLGVPPYLSQEWFVEWHQRSQKKSSKP
jgi:cell division septum initiation protein DivIVA